RHAHEKAVIHRDLKPSNLLVTEVQGVPQPKIIDFGIAKCLEPTGCAGADVTRSRLRVGSPGYMSPEALTAGSRAVDTRSDVYSLGVVLCQLLIGTRPVEPRLEAGATARDLYRDPPRPSRLLRALPADERSAVASRRNVSEGQLLRSLSRELDWIVLRAIAPEPAERYGSVAELATELERWLTGRPVKARPPSFTYRATKALRRHLVVSTAALVIATTVVAFSIRSNLLFRQAEASRLQAEELVSFMLDDLSQQLTAIGRLDLLESVARQSLSYFESARPEQLGHHPGAALRQIGNVLADRGDFEAALDAYERARRIDQRRWRENPYAPAPRLDLAQDLTLTAKVHDARGELQLAGLRLDEAEAHLRALVAEFPHHVPARVALASILSREITALRHEQDDSEGALAASEEALGMLQQLRRALPESDTATHLEIRHILGDNHYHRGLVELFSRDDRAAAIHHFKAGAAVFASLVELQPEATHWRYRLAVLEGQGLGTTYREAGRFAEAQDANRAALEHFEALVREEPANSRWAHALAWELIRQGGLAASGGELDLAATAYRRAAKLQSELLALATDTPTAWLEGLATAWSGLTEVELERGAFSAALAAVEREIATRRAIDSDAGYLRTGLAAATVTLGELHRQLGNLPLARDAAFEAQALLAAIEAPETQDAIAREQLADAS
ncbi:MAG: protein kinase, partial [Acidobacteriota bacterium]